MAAETPKRKTTTSTAVKRRYNSKHYKSHYIQLDKDLSEQWEAKLAEAGQSKAAFLRSAIENFLK